MISWVGLAAAATWSVSEGESIQASIDAAQDGDVVEVGPGTYVEQLDFMGKDLVLRSTQGPELTVLDGDDYGGPFPWTGTSVVSFTHGEPLSATLEGFTITNGHGQPVIWEVGRGWLEAGVLILNSSATIIDCIFTENHSRHSGQSLGAGVAVMRGTALIRDNVFRDNLGFWGGGGVGLVESVASIEGNLFENNLGTRGAAIIAVQRSEVDLLDNTFRSNVAGHGGHLYVKDSVLSSSLDTFEGGSAWGNGGAVAVQDAHVTIADATFEDNEAEADGGHLWVAWSGGATVMSSWLGASRASAGAVAFVRSAALSLEGLFLDAPPADAVWAHDAELQLFNLTVLEPESPLARASESAAKALNVLVSGGSGPLISGVDWEHGLAWQVDGELPPDTLEADPLLSDGVPQPGSPAIDSGSPLFNDLDGSPADIGATGGRAPWSP